MFRCSLSSNWLGPNLDEAVTKDLGRRDAASPRPNLTITMPATQPAAIARAHGYSDARNIRIRNDFRPSSDFGLDQNAHLVRCAVTRFAAGRSFERLPHGGIRKHGLNLEIQPAHDLRRRP